jgi:4'-phosphopantetheinyl transferase EntD
MFIFTKNLTNNRFIRSHKIGYLIHEPSIRVCKIEFEINNYDDSLFTEYSIELHKMLSPAVTKRRAEYLSGRIAAQTLLTERQIYGKITQSAERIPIWPNGWNGSISHTEYCAIAVITNQDKGYTLGIDIEKFNPEALEEISGMITQENERKILKKCKLCYNTALHITFSAKESLYKALYPQVNKFFGFESATITNINTQNKTFSLQLTQTLAPTLVAGYQRTGYYHLYKDKVVTIIY